MILSRQEKENIKKELAACFLHEPEVRKVVVFGSFLTDDNPNDLDIAVFQDSNEPYLPLAMKYRRITRPLARRIPMDILPLRTGSSGVMLDEITHGEVVYER
ncbi:MAG TPA: nucleotidyltransferase domain-containing protein [Desulfobulbaceae bacterium]|nr:nucleotidyltransferase domain-containing protein [Desulfobulbaceae bacterium]